ncbi:MAG: hypothetical protein NC432_02310 [Roseburia sp.]|nr:hypothetical protein [Roseburia sp.]MCM1097475.1 hypothetical protein [Ruminococcus flavefaciens]
MKKRNIVNIGLSLLAAALILTVGVKSALAYFTTYTGAEGGLPIHLGDRTEITETFDSRTKHIVITNAAGSEPVYVRARAFCTRYGFTYRSDADGIWTQEAGAWNRVVPAEETAGDWYYYKEAIPGGGSAAVLDVVIDIPSQGEDDESFNVIVVYESTPVRYDENGEPYADWTATLDVTTDTGSPEAGGDANG